jgi:hypothetical protein
LLIFADKYAAHGTRDKIELKEMKWVVFLGFSIGIVLLSWRSFRDRRSHGFYRFFAFEAILALILFNSEVLVPPAIFSPANPVWLLLLLSLFLAVHGFMLLPGWKAQCNNQDRAPEH